MTQYDMTTLKRQIDATDDAPSDGKFMSLASLRITHCPACDEELGATEDDSEDCFLCHRRLPSGERTIESAQARFQFEKDHLRNEEAEADQLLNELARDFQDALIEQRQTLEQLNEVNTKLNLERQAVTAFLPDGVMEIDMDIGKLQERARHLRRIGNSLTTSDSIEQEVELIDKKIQVLQSEVHHQSQAIDFDTAASYFVEGINEYLQKLNKFHTNIWYKGDVDVILRNDFFRLLIDKRPYKTQLGGTLNIYFIFAYHYALMRLRRQSGYNFPGLLMIDFPAEVERARDIEDKENFVVLPFVELLSVGTLSEAQVIITGRAFKDLEGVNRIELSDRW